MTDTSASLPSLSGPEAATSSGKAAKQLVILLHGYGSNGEDLFSLTPNLRQILPDAAFISPNAPFDCEMMPPGYPGYQWFSLADGITPDTIASGARDAGAILDAFIDAQLERFSLSDKDLALIGFSQGTMVALHTVLRRKKPVGAMIGYSGLLAAPDKLAEEIVSRPPVFLAHGTADEVVPFDLMAVTEEALRANDVEVESVICPGLGHGIDGEGLSKGLAFLGERLLTQTL